MRALAAVLATTALAPGVATAQCKVGQMLEMKATMEGLRPMVDATINGHRERFLADSGAFFSSISPGKAAELGLRLSPLPVGYTIHGIGGEQSASLAVVKSLELAGVSLHDIQFIVGGSEVGPGAGLLGQNVLGIADVEYDLAHGVIRLMRPHGCRGLEPVYWSGNQAVTTVTLEPRTPSQRHTIGYVAVNGVKMRAIFDTGAGRSVMSLAAAARIGLRPGSPGVRAAGYASGIGRRTTPNYVVPIESIKFGDGEEIHRTHIQAANIGMDESGDMLIGADFFLSHRVYVANEQHRLFFTYDGGPVFNVTPSRIVSADGTPEPAADAAAGAPTDAAGFAGRGAAFLSRRDYPHALADLDEAVRRAPDDPRFLMSRAEARMRSGDRAGARADLDAVLKLAPDTVDARLARAQMRLRADRAGAAEDVAALDHELPPAADPRFALAGLYGALDRPADQLSQWDQWLRFHPDDSRRPTALNGRCWARARLGTDLSKALSDCDAAIRARPGVASYLDSRGLVRLRMGDTARAIRDYDAALAIDPKVAWSLYGRGLAKRRSGQPGGDADLAAAAAINPGLPDQAKALGLAP